MTTCNLCPPGSPDVPDDQMSGHLHDVHPEVSRDGTLRSDGSTIVQDASLAPDAEHQTGDQPWRG